MKAPLDEIKPQAEPGDAAPGAKKTIWLRVAGTLLTVALLVYLIQLQGWDEIRAALLRVEGWRLWLSLAFMLLSRSVVGLRWHALFREVDGRIRATDALRISFAGLFAANFLPTTIGGDVIRLAACLQLRFDAALSAASLIADRLVGMAGMALFLPVGLLRLREVGLPQTGTATPVASAAFWAGLNEKIKKFWERILTALRIWLARPKALAIALLFTLIHQACLYLTIRLMLEGMGEPIGWLQIAGIWSLVYFITLLPVSINGYGLQEVSTVLLYSHLAGISLESSAALALLQRVIQMAASLPGVFFAPGIIAARRKGAQDA